MDHSIKKGDPLYHLTAAGYAEQCAPLLAVIDASGCCVSGQALVAYELAKAGKGDHVVLRVLQDFANICQRVVAGRCLAA